MEDEVYKILSTDTELCALLGRTGSNRIYNSPIAPLANEFPRITMFDAGEDDFDGADNAPVYTEHHVRVDVWHNKDDLKKIKTRIKKVIRSAIWDADISVGGKIYEPDTKIYHVPIDIYIYEG